MSDGNTTKRRIAITGTVIAVSAAAVIAGPGFVGGGDDDAYVVKVMFKDAAGLRKNGDVKIGGVVAGRIEDLELTPQDTALATLSLKPEAAPIGAGASARARPVNLLGEKYLDLDPGDVRRPADSGTSIGAARTSAPVELDDTLNMLDPSTRARLRIVINEAGVALGGKGTNLNATLERLPRSLDQVTELVRSLDDTPRLKRLISEGDRTIAAFADGKDDVTRLVDVAERTLEATADARAGLGDTLDAAPATLGQLQSTLNRLSTTSQRLKPVAAELRQTAPPLQRTLVALPKFRTAAKPALKSVEDVSPTLGRLGTQATPIVRRLRPVAGDLTTFAGLMSPFSTVLDEQTNPILRVLEGWARAIQLRDNAGHVFRTELVIDHEAAETLLNRLTPATAEQNAPKGLDNQPLSRAKHPDPAPAPAPAGGSSPATGDAPSATPPEAPATPATEADASNLLDFLLK